VGADSCMVEARSERNGHDCAVGEHRPDKGHEVEGLGWEEVGGGVEGHQLGDVEVHREEEDEPGQVEEVLDWVDAGSENSEAVAGVQHLDRGLGGDWEACQTSSLLGERVVVALLAEQRR
jgi:hypothetical protein